jgi:hypothetical protein
MGLSRWRSRAWCHPETLLHRCPKIMITGLFSKLRRVPALRGHRCANGPESPPRRLPLARRPEVRDLFVATGFNSVGIAASGGVGKVVADWIRDRRPPMDLADVDVRRVVPFQANALPVRSHYRNPLPLMQCLGLCRTPPPGRAPHAVARPLCAGAVWERDCWLGAANWYSTLGRPRITNTRTAARTGSTGAASNASLSETRRASTRPFAKFS